MSDANITNINGFVVLAHGRSGSSILTNNLNSHSLANCYGELFHDVEETRWKIEGRCCAIEEDAYKFCDEVVYSAQKAPVTHVGFKIFPYHAHQNEKQLGVWRYLRERKDIKIIVLERSNLFDAYVSNMRSIRSGLWYLDVGTRDISREKHEESIRIEPAAFTEYATGTILGMSWAMKYLGVNDRQHLRISYDEMESDFQATMSKIFSFLGLPQEPITFKFERLNRVPSVEGVENFAELKSHFARSFFREYFFED